MKKDLHRGNITRCPHCGTRCTSIKTRQLAPTCREITYQCANEACGHLFVATLEAVRTLSPSATPNPDVHLPVVVITPRGAA